VSANSQLELTLDIREWDCLKCNTHHDRDGNAALNIRNEGIRILSMGGGNPVIAEPRRSKTTYPLMKRGICQWRRKPTPYRKVGVGSSQSITSKLLRVASSTCPYLTGNGIKPGKALSELSSRP